MSMKDVIRQKRKEPDYTQEQIAEQLGVSIPAVSKWESGATCPDVEMIPALARVLKTDVNSLLCFKQELSDLEIGNFVKKVVQMAMSKGMKDAFAVTEEKMREYPTDVKLIHTLAMTLQGSMMMTESSDNEKEEYDRKIQSMYEKVGRSGYAKYANQSNYMLASRFIRDGKYERAQELIDLLPEYSALDKKMLQANLWMKTDQVEEAEKVYAYKLLAEINNIQIPLCQLIDIAVQKGDTKNAEQLVECGEVMTKVFGFWDYNSYIFSFEKALAEENVADTLQILDQMLTAMLTPWDMSMCPIFKHIGEKKEETNLTDKMLSSIITDLEKSQKYDFLRGEVRFNELILKFRH